MLGIVKMNHVIKTMLLILLEIHQGTGKDWDQEQQASLVVWVQQSGLSLKASKP